MIDHREKTLNIGCLGVVSIGVYENGYWNMILEAKNGKTYLRSEDSDLGDAQFVNIDNLYNPEIIEIDGWMWDQFLSEVEELKLMWDRDALFTPEVKGATA
jgi:hypothetical protein